MMTGTTVALVAALAVCVAPSAMAYSRTHHARTHHVAHPQGYGSAYPDGGGYQWSPARIGWAVGLIHRRKRFDLLPSHLPGFTPGRKVQF
jgi:hypothetical protein